MKNIVFIFIISNFLKVQSLHVQNAHNSHETPLPDNCHFGCCIFQLFLCYLFFRIVLFHFWRLIFLSLWLWFRCNLSVQKRVSVLTFTFILGRTLLLVHFVECTFFVIMFAVTSWSNFCDFSLTHCQRKWFFFFRVAFARQLYKTMWT